MIISMVVILAFVMVWIAMVPRVNRISRPPADVAAVATYVRDQTGWPIVEPQGLPAGWYPSSVRYVASTDGLMTFHAGYVSPDGNYVQLEQTQGATGRWVANEIGRGRPQGTLRAAGQTWEKFSRTDKRTLSLVHRGSGPKDLTTLVTGTAPYAELVAFIDTLEPVARSPRSASAQPVS